MTGKIPATVTREQMLDAIEPLLTLLGTDARSVFDKPGLHIEADAITLTVVRGVVDSAAPGRIVRVGSDPTTQEWGVELTIPVVA